MLSIHWPQVIVVTITCYLLILAMLPFNSVYATIFLYALISYWSRLPGVGIPTPFFILYFADFVDLFSVIIAVNVGGIEGAIFSAFGNFGSRFAGVFPKWWGVARDGTFQFILCLAMPYVHSWTGGDIYVDMMVFTVVRRLMFIPVYFIYQDIPLPNFAILWPGATAAQLIINGFYGKHFGPFFDSLIQQGVKFPWLMFLIVTVTIYGASMLFVKDGGKYLDQSWLLKLLIKKLLGEKKKKPLKPVISDELLVYEIRDEIKKR